MAQKYKVVVNSNQPVMGTNPQVVKQLQNQIAQNQVNQQLQANQPSEDDLRITVNDLVKNQLLTPVEVPRFTTIQDIVNAQKGNRLEKFGEYLGNNPDVTRLVGSLVGGTYMDRFGRFVNEGDVAADRQIDQMNMAQREALSRLKEQQDLANSVYNAYKQMDIADMNDKRARELAEQELNFRKEQNALDRSLKREQMAQQERLSRLIHGGGGGSASGGTVTGQAANINNINDLKMTAAERKQLTENKTTLANIESGLNALEKNKDAYTLWKGLLGSDITNRIDPKGVATRTQIDNITAVYRKWLTGAQMSDKERKAYERFLPAPTDNYNIVKAKLNGMKGAIERSNDAILSNYGVSQNASSDPLGLGL